METNTICGLSPKEIDELKIKHHNIIVIQLTTKGKTHTAVFKEPTMQIMQAVNNMQKQDEFKGISVMYDNCIIAADDAITNRDMLKIKAIQGLNEYLNDCEIEEKNV